MTPTLTTDRLILRRPQADDLAAYGAYCASDRTRLGGGPFSTDQARGFLEAMIAQWDSCGYGRFVVTKDGQPIGHAGLLHDTEVELTWFLWEAATEGHGYATEAARAVLDWAATRWPAGQVISRIAPDNARSIALAKRLGGTPVAPDQLPTGETVLRFRHQLPVPSAPLLRTDRLLLRPHIATDIDALVTLMGTPRARYMGGPMDPDTAWRWLMSDTALWQTKAHGPWGIERLSDGAFLGQVSVAQPPNFPEMELGWVLLEPHEGQGYAQEAARAARDWARAQGEPALVSYIDPENARSIALAKRLGAEVDAEAPKPDPEALVFRHWGAS